jgi:hypothetical protein
VLEALRGLGPLVAERLLGALELAIYPPGVTPVVQPPALLGPKCRWPAIGLGMDV